MVIEECVRAFRRCLRTSCLIPSPCIDKMFRAIFPATTDSMIVTKQKYNASSPPAVRLDSMVFALHIKKAPPVICTWPGGPLMTVPCQISHYYNMGMVRLLVP